MISLRKPNVETARAEWELLQKIPESENGFNNEFHGIPYEDYINITIPAFYDHEKGINLKPGYVPDTHYFLWADDTPVGYFSLRHYLNDFLREGPGHIGYGIAKEFRGKGYATEGLRLLLEEAKKLPIDTDEAYLSALKTNPASLRVMLKNGAKITREDDERVYTRIKLA